MMSSRQPMAWLTSATPFTIRSWMLPAHTSVPWEKPESRTSVSKARGWVSTSIWRVKGVPNSGTPIEPVWPMIGSSSGSPSTSGEVKIDMVSGSEREISLASTPVISSIMRIIVGSSCPSSSSFRRLASMQ